jgi:hypothetical protein
MPVSVLTEDDKKWISDLLDQNLERFETKLDLDQKLERFETKLDLEQRLERLETKLLTAFHNWASPIESRQRSHSSMGMHGF